MNREKLRQFRFPGRVQVHRSQYEYVYWEFIDGRGWTVLCTIFPDDPGPKTPCLHFTSDKAWDALYFLAKEYGYEDEPCLT
jgi:hypothetical protein